jgi:hypothetical protein
MQRKQIHTDVRTVAIQRTQIDDSKLENKILHLKKKIMQLDITRKTVIGSRATHSVFQKWCATGIYPYRTVSHAPRLAKLPVVHHSCPCATGMCGLEG